MATASALLFTLGFLGGLWHVGFWEKIVVADFVQRPSEENLLAKMEYLRKLTLEMDAWRVTAKKRSDALDKRDARLRESESNVSLQTAAMDKIQQEIKKMQTQLDARLLLVETAQQANNKQLAKIYTAMTPEGAAEVLAKIPDDEVAQVFRLMKENHSAKILEVWGGKGGDLTEKAAHVIKLMRVAIEPPTEENAP